MVCLCFLEEELPASYYRLQHQNTSLCLATGFSRFNQTLERAIFNRTEAGRITGDSVYSQAVLLGVGEEDKCAESGAVAERCIVDSFDPDPKMNFLSLVMLGLRLLFLKTIVFNVLLTARACVR
ncbi:hypothetical protein LDENG_00087130 [Lucifuga dentata]|nr:hypothetical protein LDENG_00087130 [Lucifuga dentata]